MYVSDSRVHIGGVTSFDNNSAEVSLGGREQHSIENV